ncbi:MAG TPA: class I SAM-dependent methyltransferase [Solirubrobacterales bacterium]|nr:class I SAM-dependent methyltransferase [Solirubrobacterales bacterium]
MPGKHGDKAARARSFGAAADAYERARPGYPDAAVDWLVPEGARTVLDLGAGTGKLTRSLVARGLDVVALEPLTEMRETLAAAVPEARSLAGTAEDIPLPDASVDAITVGQAWHWVDPARATAEAARVLRPNGTLGLIWNRRDDRVDWIVRLTEVMGSADVEVMDMDSVEIGPPFGPTERFTVDWQRPMDVDLLVDMAASRSYVITATSRRRREILAGVRHMVETDPHLGTEFDLPYRTYCYRAALPT